MQTTLSEHARTLPRAEEAERILRSCVHCGFCNATCPTYQLLGDELDGPRGRIYLIKQVLEGQPVTEKTRVHLDRCLSCRNCETTCPSGVDYHNLLDIGRAAVEALVPRPLAERVLREGLRRVIPHPGLFKSLTGMGLKFRPLLPQTLATKLPETVHPGGLRPHKGRGCGYERGKYFDSQRGDRGLARALPATCGRGVRPGMRGVVN